MKQFLNMILCKLRFSVKLKNKSLASKLKVRRSRNIGLEHRSTLTKKATR